jgi:amino acid adenylation domain-containing protein
MSNRDSEIADLDESSRLAKIKNIKDKLKKISGQSPAIPSALPIHLGGDNSYISSFAQQRLWFIDQMEADVDGSAYHIAGAFEICGKLDIVFFEAAIQEIVSRHEALRTTFDLGADGQVYQHVKADLVFNLQHEQLSQATDVSALEDIAKEEIKKRFSLATGPLFRVKLFQLRDDSFHVVYTMHHIISDAWSMAVMLQEIAKVYAAKGHALHEILAPVTYRYSDYAVDQRNNDRRLSDGVEYWRRHLEGAPELINLPSDHARPAKQSFRGDRVYFELDEDTTSALNHVAASQNVTLFILLLAIFSFLLAKFSQQKSVVIATPLANRQKRELENVIGFFVNTIALKIDINTDSSFIEFLNQVRQTILESFKYNETPFEKVVEALNPARNLSHTPIYQVMMVNRTTPHEVIELPGLRMQGKDINSDAEQCDLTFSYFEHDKKISGFFSFATDVFARKTVGNWVNYYKRLIHSVLQSPHQHLRHIDIYSELERQSFLQTSLGPWRPYPCLDIPLNQQFSQQAQRTPDAIAISDSQGELTYRDLDQRSQQLANYLCAQGVRADALVGLAMTRGTDAVVGLLAILKAGGAYVPLDPYYPPARIERMLSQSQPAWILSQRCHRELFRGQAGEVILVDDAAAAYHQASYRNAACTPEQQADDLAYVIYTSGSTGIPKGVALSHRTLTNLIQWHYEEMGAGQRFLQFASLSFDASFHEIFAALLCGARVVVIDEESRKDTGALVALLEREMIDRAIFPVSVLHVLAQECASAPERLRHLREVMATGEALKVTGAVKALFQQLPDCRLHNHYGPSETHVITGFTLGPDVAQWPAFPSIGRPIANSSVYILDEHQRPQPPGVMGELYLGGLAVARGYWGNAALTQEKFIANPFGAGRLYRSGDVGRWREDGSLDYQGRNDDQIKLRGFRIELGEIEQALLSHPAIEDALVQVDTSIAEEKRLVAYIIPTAGAESGGVAGTGAGIEINSAAVRQHLAQRLPDYMLPWSYVFLREWPLSPTGKVDRRALPAPEVAHHHHYEAPQSALEIAIAALWQQVLAVPGIGLQDNFFQVGGHSLSATRMIALVNQQWHCQIPVKTIFQHQTLGHFCAAVQANPEAGPRRPPLVAMPDNAIPYASYAQQRLWLIDQIGGGSAQYHLPGAFRLTGTLDLAALTHAFTALLQRHESLRTSFRVDDAGELVQVIHAPTSFNLALHDWQQMPASEQEAAVNHYLDQEAHQPFSLAQAPLLRASVLQLSAQESVLAVTLHHICSDGWSQALLIREIRQHYQDYQQGTVTALAPLPVQYKDYAWWQRQWLAEGELTRQLAYWGNRLAALPVVHNLPLDYPRPKEQRFEGRVHHSRLKATLVSQLTTFCQAHQATLFMGLHAVFVTLLARYSQEEDIVLGTPVANRDQAEVNDVIGFFVNTLVLRSDLSRAPDFPTLLAQSRDDLLAAYAHQHTPFEQVVEHVQPERSHSHSPLFQIMLALQNTERADYDLAGVAIDSIGRDTGVAKYDLTLNMQQQADGLHLYWEYDCHLFAEASIQRLATNFQRVLAAWLVAPDTPYPSLDFLSDEERQVLRIINNTAVSHPGPGCIHALVEQQVRQTPDAIAVEWNGESLSYAALNRRANQLAHYLLAQGAAGPDRLVGVCVERTLDLVISVLAIVKSGSAYVPLDASYPAERLAYIVQDAALANIITHRGLEDRLGATGARHLCLDDAAIRSAVGAASVDDLPWPGEGEAGSRLAYVIYTSGSTGQPKGVMIEHHSTVALIHWAKREFSAHQLSGMLASTSICFDLSVFEIFVPLSVGGTVHVYENILHLPESDSAEKITFINTVPSAIKELLEVGGIPASATTIGLAGEALNNMLVQRLYANGTEKVYNLYGPSEDTTYSTYKLVGKGDGRSMASIGKPISNTQLYIMDKNLQLLPYGCIGELFIAGQGLARGYLNKNTLTDKQFIQLPINHQITLLYKTGDLVKFSESGDLLYLGRNDEQVKIRGFRIELDEITSHLKNVEGIDDAIVLALSDEQGRKKIRAYLLAPGGGIKPHDVKILLSKKLPSYAIPSDYVILTAWPLNPNGKIDKNKLRQLVCDAENQVGNAPDNPLHQRVASVWADTLNLTTVVNETNFFVSGGSSLQALGLIAKLNNILGKNIPIKVLFDNPVLSSFCAELDSLPTGNTPSPLTKIPLGQRYDVPLPVTKGQEELWLLEQSQAGKNFNRLNCIIKIKGPVNIEKLVAAINYLVENHEAFRTKFAFSEGQVVQIVSPRKAITLEPCLPQEKEAFFARPFNLSEGKTFWLGLANPSENHHELWLSINHIIADAISLNIVLDEIFTHYKNLPRDERPSAQITDYVTWNQALLAQREQENNDYWLKIFSSPINNLFPPVNHSPQPATDANSSCFVDVSGDALHRFNDAAGSAGVSNYLLIKSLFNLILYRLSGVTDIAIGSPISLRDHPEIENTVGFFVGTIVTRCALNTEISWPEFIRDINSLTREAIQHKDISFVRLQHEIARRHGKGSLLFNAWLNHIEKRAVYLGSELEVDVEEFNQSAHKYDLALTIEEGNHTMRLIVSNNRRSVSDAMANELLDGIAHLIKHAGSFGNNTLASILADLDKQSSDDKEKHTTETKANRANALKKLKFERGARCES